MNTTQQPAIVVTLTPNQRKLLRATVAMRHQNLVRIYAEHGEQIPRTVALPLGEWIDLCACLHPKRYSSGGANRSISALFQTIAHATNDPAAFFQRLRDTL